MKRFKKSMLGITLLEIMLVLAIAAMIIVMSVRYYQSASSSQQATQVYAQLQAITAAAEGLATAQGTYQGTVSTETIKPLLPANGLSTPWGGQITITAKSPSTYGVSVNPTPATVCPLIVAKLKADPHYQSPACDGTNLTYTYSSTAL